MKKILLIFLLFLMLCPMNLLAEERLNIKVGPSNPVDKEIKLSTKANFQIISSDFSLLNNTNLKELKVTFKNGKVYLKGENFTMENFPLDGSMLINSSKEIKVENLKRSYLGAISFRINNNKLDIINNIDIENYLRGILPKEMSPSFSQEALKAQAVASRSFAISNKNKCIKNGYNLDDTTACQVYRGSSCYNKITDKAVEATKGQVLTYKGKVIEAIFGASSGGYTADAKDVWGGEIVDYLIAKEDPYSTYEWDAILTNQELSKLGLGEIYTIEIADYDSSGRIKNITVTGANGVKNFTGNQFRNKVGSMKCKSTLFEIMNLGDSFSLKGKGFGHGVGMSQYGAQKMAKSDFKYEEILGFYFPGTELKSMEGVNENK